MARQLLVIGRQGQLASALAHAADGLAAFDVECVGRPQVDLARPDSIAAVIDRVQPDLILNAGAYTNVDAAESEPELCHAVNATGAGHLARAAEAHRLALIHISTDCVFDGQAAHAYRETDPARPLSAYGVSKLAGEDAVREIATRSLVVRVSWVFSRFGASFPRTMLALARTRDTLRVVSDQFGCPTHAEDLAGGLLQMADAALASNFDGWGLYHLAGRGDTDRASMARAIFAQSRLLDGPQARVEPVLTSDYGAPANRPLNARLDSMRAEETFGVRLPEWQARLDDCVRELLTSEASE